MSGAVLVTGASGFLGRHVLEALGREGERPRALALVRDADAWRRLDWTEKLDFVDVARGSVLETGTWRDACSDLRAIVHLAALVRHSRRAPEEMERTNVEGTLRMVELAAARGARLVFVSTSGTVGCFRSREAWADEDAPYADAEVARWPYYRSKVEAEKRARARARELGVELVVLRPPVLLGPGDHRFRSSSNLIRALQGRLPFVVRGGMHFADVRDVAGAVARAALGPHPRPVYHLPGTACECSEFFEMVERVSGAPAPRWVVPFRPAWLLASGLARLGSSALPDPVVVEMAAHYWGLRSRHASELGYRPRDPLDTLADAVEWLRAHHPGLGPS